MIAPKVIHILLALFSCALLSQASVNLAPASGTKIKTILLQRNKQKDVGNPIAKRQKVLVPSAQELYDDYGRRYLVNQLPLFRAHYLDREPTLIEQQFPFRSDEEPLRQRYIPRQGFSYDGDLVSPRDESNDRFLDEQDYENTLQRTGNFMTEDQERQRPALEEVPSRLPFEPAMKYQETLQPFEELADSRVIPVSPIPSSQDKLYTEFQSAHPVIDGYPQRISSQDDPVLWHQKAIDLRAKAEALEAEKHLKRLIEEVGPTVTLKQVLDKYGPKVASLFSNLQYASGARLPNPINETKFTPKPAKTTQFKPQKILTQIHDDKAKGVENKAGLTKTNHTESNLTTLELASEVTKEAKDFIKIFNWFNKYYKSFRHKNEKVDDENPKVDEENDTRKEKKVRIEKMMKNEHQRRERIWDNGNIEKILNNL